MEDGGGVEEGGEEHILLQVRVPEVGVEKTLQFSKASLIWEVKQQILAALPKELDEGFNYGLFLPPTNCKAGKFLDEERVLAEYPFQATLNPVELKYKKKVYKELSLDQKQLKTVNSKSNQKKFLEHILSNNTEKISKLINKGLDPNFHCPETGETPLSLVIKHQRSAKTILVLVNGGALIDFRTKDGSTPMHRSVSSNRYEAAKTLLDLGGSPNYRDGKGLTPLYLSVLGQAEPNITQLLLHERAAIGSQDLQGWQEVHQCCRSGLVQHLEFLLFYQADCNARNASGNTPMHVCAVNNQEGCARLLLFRGADREILNYAGQTAYQVSIIAGNHDLATVIQNHNPATSVGFNEVPKYNPRRRVSAAPLSRTMSDCGSLQYDTLRRIESPLTGYLIKPSSPSLSDRSMPPFSSGSSVSGTSTGSGGSNSTSQEEEQLDSASTLAASMAGNEDVLSLSSGVGTSSNSGSGGSAATPTGRETVLLPGTTVVAVDNYNNNNSLDNHLNISKGDVVELTGSTDTGLLEGSLRGQVGLFPRHLVEELRYPAHPKEGAYPVHVKEGPTRKELVTEGGPSPKKEVGAVQLRQEGGADYPVQEGGAEYQAVSKKELGELTSRHFGTATRAGVTLVAGLPRQCVLHKGRKGFGFVLRGAKAASPLMMMIPSFKCPSLQYMDDVDPGGVADMAGIMKGDFLLSINNKDVTKASHETVVQLIRESGDLVNLTVVTVTPEQSGRGTSSTLPARGFSTLPRKPSLIRMPLQGAGRAPLQHPPPPPRRDPATTLSVGRARAKSMVANLATLESLSAALREKDPSALTEAKSEDGLNKAESGGGGKEFARELEVIFRRNSGLTAGTFAKDISSTSSSPIVTVRNFSSVAQMKKHKKGSYLLHSQFNSTPDLQSMKQGGVDTLDTELPDLEEVVTSRRSLSQEDLKSLDLGPQTGLKDGSDHRGYFTLPGKGRRTQEDRAEGRTQAGEETYRTLTRIRPVQIHSAEGNRTLGPAPDHPPPPPPPLTHMVTLSTGNTDYAKVGGVVGGPASSFKPATNAKLYSSPKGVVDVAYMKTAPKEDGVPKKKSPTRTHSLPPRPTKPLVLKRAEEPLTAETYAVNGVNYTTYTTFRSPLTPDQEDDRLYEDEDNSETPTNERTPEEDNYPLEEYAAENYPPRTPHIPEPDYDVSDVENGSFSGSDSSWRDQTDTWRDTATLRRNQRNERKKKKTVSFIMNQDIANIIHSSGTMTKKESILKDTKREEEVSGEAPGCWRPTKRSPTKQLSLPAKVSPPKSSIKKKSSMKSAVPPHLEWEGGSLADWDTGVKEPLLHPETGGGRPRAEEVLTQPKLVSTSRIRIEVGSQNGRPVAGTPTISRSHSFSSGPSLLGTQYSSGGGPLQQDLCPPEDNARMKMQDNLDIAANSVITQSEIQKARTQLKSSRSLPDMIDEQDNSSSGVSSDQDPDTHSQQQEGDYVTQLIVSPTCLPMGPWGRGAPAPWVRDEDSTSSGTGSSHSEDLTDKTWILQTKPEASAARLEASAAGLPVKGGELKGRGELEEAINRRRLDVDRQCRQQQEAGRHTEAAGHRQIDTAGHRQIDTAGHSRIDTADHVQMDAAGHRQTDTAGHRQMGAAGHRQIDPADHRQIDTAVHRQMDTAGHRQMDAATYSQLELAGRRPLDAAGHGEQAGVSNLQQRLVHQPFSPNQMEMHRQGWESVEIEWGEEIHYQNCPNVRQSSPRLGDHVNVRRPFRVPDDRMSRSLSQESSSTLGGRGSTSGGRGSLLRNHSSASTVGLEDSGSRSIDQSLALIHHHLQDINHCEVYEGVPPPPPPSGHAPPLAVCPSPQATPPLAPPLPLLAPPPGFSDSEHSLSDCDSLVNGRGGNFNRFGPTRISRAPGGGSVGRRADNSRLQMGNGGDAKFYSDFSGRSLLEWSVEDVGHWLHSLNIPEYKAAFLESGVDGGRLVTLDNRDWERLGVTNIAHRFNILKSIKKYMPKKLTGI